MKTKMKRLWSILLSLVLTLCLMPGMHLTTYAADGDVSYLYYEDSAPTTQKTGTKAQGDYTLVGRDTTEWGAANAETWYVVSTPNLTISDRVTVTGTVNLILCDGAALTARAGITVEGTNTLNIYSQSGGSGTLAASAFANSEDAGIGGCSQVGSCGTVTIHGGIVTADGDLKGAGIGGCMYKGGTVIVYNGTVTAIGGSASSNDGGGAGIGGGAYGSGGSVTIYGGTVTAVGGDSLSMGIGGGSASAENGTLTLGEGIYLYGGDSENPTANVPLSEGDYARHRYMVVNSTAPSHTHDGITFQPWVSETSLPTRGNYYLTSDVTLTGTWKIEHREIHLCLNGHSIIDSADGSVIKLNATSIGYPDTVLNLYDCAGGGTITHADGKTGMGVELYSNNGETATFNMYGGIITGNDYFSNSGSYAGGVTVKEGCTFNLYGGKITDNTRQTYYSGASADYGAGGVYVSGAVFNMFGGEISGNKTLITRSGGGVIVSSSATFNMSGGSIKENHATSSYGTAGVALYGGTFNMSGGSIEDNSAAGDHGSGVLVDDGTFNLSGDITITGNTTTFSGSAAASNVFLRNVNSDPMIHITGELGNTTPIGVALYSETGVFADGLREGAADKFTGDDASLTVRTAASGEGVLVRSGTVHEHDGVIFDIPWNLSNRLPSRPGNYYLESDVTLSRGWTYSDRSGALRLCLDGHTIAGDNDGPTITASSNDYSAAGLYIYDKADNSGKITHKPGNTGVGVLVKPGYFYLYGGQITGNNSSENGGGVYVEQHGYFYFRAGSITGNTTTGEGGGVYVEPGSGDYPENNRGALILYNDNGTTSPVIQNNTKNGAANNVYLVSGQSIGFGCAGSNVNWTMSDAARIGVTMQTTGRFTSSMGDHGTAGNFTSDNPNLAVKLTNVASGMGMIKEAALATVDPSFAKYSLSLDGDIGVNFYLNLSEAQAARASVTFKWMKNGAERTETVNVNEAAKTADGYKVTCRVSASEIRTDITANLFVTDGQGDPLKDTTTYSVARYANVILNDLDFASAYNNNPERLNQLRALANAMLAYGDNARAFFDAGAEAVESAPEADIPQAYAPHANNLPDGVIFEGSTLSLRSKTTLSLYFKNTDGTDTVQLTMDGKNEGEHYELEHNGDEHVIRIRNISAPDLGDDFTVKVNGTEFKYNPMTYCYIAQSSDNPKLVNTVKALYSYWDAAEKYFID